jgi:aspartate/methionine/tyrosine aminotransferase
MADDLARRAGLLVSPGEFYGPGGTGHVRIAVVQPTDRIELVCERLGR